MPLAVRPLIAAYMALAVFLAGVVRGYSGFGFSALVVTSLSLVLAPARIVPVVLLLEVIASVSLLPAVWRRVDRRWLVWLVLGVAISTPLGVYLLARLPEAPMRVAISTLVLLASVVMGSGWGLRTGLGGGGRFATGLLCGIVNGATGLGGLMVVVVLLATQVEVSAIRATLIALFFATDLYACLLAAVNGLLRLESAALTAVMLVPLFLGIRLGHGWFSAGHERHFRTAVLWLLGSLAVAGMVRALV